MIKQFSFWLFKPKMTLCGVSAGILRELDKKINNGVSSIDNSYDCIRRANDMEFRLLK